LSQYRIDLEMFAGPLDLLLYLVRKEELDIYDIPITNITRQYLGYIEMLKELDIDLAGDFLVMAATLMEIKSAMLLPRDEDQDQGQEDFSDPRTELVRQLLEYKKFKDAANLLQISAVDRKDRFTRPDSIIAGLKDNASEPEVDLDEVSIWTLLEAFDAIMQATGNYASYDHIKDDTPIDLYQIEILHRLQSEGAMTFERVFADRENKLAMIGLFLAMLELIRSSLIWFEQPEAKGPIYIKSLTDEPAEQAVQNAIMANMDDEETQPEESSPEQTELMEEPQVGYAKSEGPMDDETESALPQENDRKPPISIQELPAKKPPSYQPDESMLDTKGQALA